MSKATLYIGDNVSVMRKHIPNNSVQLTVTSPPYDNLRKYNGFTWDFEAVARELFQVTKQGGVVVWVVADATVNGSETGTSFKQALYFKECGFNLHDTMVYEKAGTGACGSNLAYWQTWEYMFVFAKGRPSVVNRLKQANLSAGAVSGRKRLNTSEGNRTETKTEGRVCTEFGVRSNIWRYNVNKFGMDYLFPHPAKFPFKLAEDHILSWSNPGDLVIDPFSGSGTTGKMAVNNNRDFIGIEISSEYISIAAHRIPTAEVIDTTAILESVR